jgi:3-dehydroquinate dehydratase-2
MTGTIWLLSGPNLDLLGEREPGVYGTMSLDEHVARFTELAASFGCGVHHVQSNFEGDLVEAVHAARATADAIVINAGALTHYSWSLRDALAAFDGIRIEVHLSNPAARESFRQLSTLAAVVDGTIAGFGATSYDLAAYAVRDLLGARGQ